MASYYAYGVAEVRAFVGREVGPGAWRAVNQHDVDRFADVTHDRQWIHVDPAAASTSPSGGTVIHGNFILSLVMPLFADLLEISGFDTVVNYGFDRVRFPAPAPTGGRLRVTARVTSFDEVDDGEHQMRATFTVYSDLAQKPVCVADGLLRYLEAADAAAAASVAEEGVES
ncbi:MAG: MaoC family dehydratase [Mycobacterium sp.]